MNNTLSEVCSLLLKIQKEFSSVISKNDAKVHEAIFNIQKECPDMFTDLIFDESGITPFSDELERILFGLESGEVLSTPNSEYRKYEIKDVAFLENKAKDCKKDMTKALNIFKSVMI